MRTLYRGNLNNRDKIYKSSAQEDNWYTAGRVAQRTFYAPTSLSASLEVKFSPIITGVTPWATVNGILYTTNKNEPPTIYAVDLGNNTVRWKFTTEDNAGISFVMANDEAILASTGKKIYRIKNVGDHYELSWAKEIGPGTNWTMSFDDKNLYYNYIDNQTTYPVNIRKVNAIDISTGVDRWSYPLDRYDDPPQVITTGGGKIFFVVTNQMKSTSTLFALDAATADVQWTAPLYPSLAQSTNAPAYYDGKIYIDMESSSPPQTITAYAENDGRTLWQYKLANRFNSLFGGSVFSVNETSVISSDNKGNLFALDKDTGQVKWNVVFADKDQFGNITSTEKPILLSRDKIFIENEGKIKIIDSNNGSQLSVIQSTTRLTPAEIASKLLIVSDGSKLYAYGETTPPPAPAFQDYTVVRGDTLSSIALRFGTTADYLARLNNIPNASMIFVGQVIRVPVPATPPPPPPAPAPLVVNYTIKKGDILAAISRKYKVPVSDIVSYNNISDPNKIFIGETLKIPITNYTVYTVAPGDTLWAIAKKFNTAVSLLAEINQLEFPNNLMVGQKLYII